MIQIVLLTGFLGAGKTTLMQSMLESYEGKKIGVIVNEFGEINIDAKLIQKEGMEMAELSNGSIFCACIKDKFVDSLIEMSGRELDYLFIEASGLADPANFASILDGIKPYTITDYNFKGSICVVDAVNFVELSQVLPALAHQVEYSNAVIVNKADLVEEEDFEEIFERIRELNEDISVNVTSYCKIDILEVVENFVGFAPKAGETTNTYESRPNSFILKATETLDKEKLVEFINHLAPNAYRIKGFAKTNEGNIEIQAVITDIHVTDWDEEIEETVIVVISSVGIKMLSQIVNASKDFLDGKIKL